MLRKMIWIIKHIHMVSFHQNKFTKCSFVVSKFKIQLSCTFSFHYLSLTFGLAKKQMGRIWLSNPGKILERIRSSVIDDIVCPSIKM